MRAESGAREGRSLRRGALQFARRLPLGSERLRWAPSGKAIQYLLTRNGATNVWEQPLSGGEPRQVTNFPSGRIFDFAWSRDGRQLLLTKSNQSGDVISHSKFPVRLREVAVICIARLDLPKMRNSLHAPIISSSFALLCA